MVVERAHGLTGPRVVEHAGGLCDQLVSRAQAVLGRGGEQVVVRHGAPEEVGQPRGHLVVRKRHRAAPGVEAAELETVEEARRLEHRLQDELDCLREAPRISRNSEELEQPIRLVRRERAPVCPHAEAIHELGCTLVLARGRRIAWQECALVLDRARGNRLCGTEVLLGERRADPQRARLVAEPRGAHLARKVGRRIRVVAQQIGDRAAKLAVGKAANGRGAQRFAAARRAGYDTRHTAPIGGAVADVTDAPHPPEKRDERHELRRGSHGASCCKPGTTRTAHCAGPDSPRVYVAPEGACRRGDGRSHRAAGTRGPRKSTQQLAGDPSKCLRGRMRHLGRIEHTACRHSLFPRGVPLTGIRRNGATGGCRTWWPGTGGEGAWSLVVMLTAPAIRDNFPLLAAASAAY